MSIIVLLVLGLIVGALGRLINPGREAFGWIVTMVIGVAAVLITGLIIGGGHGIIRFIIAVIVGVVLVALVSRLMAGRSGTARA